MSKSIRITNATLRSLRAKDKDYFIRDSQLRGFHIKVPPSGRAVYQVEARMSGVGKLKKFKIASVQEMDLPQARERAVEALQNIREGIDPSSVKKAREFEGMKFSTLFEDYIENKDLKESTLKEYRSLYRGRMQHWARKRVIDITKHEIRDWFNQGRRKTVRQANKAFTLLNSLMNYAQVSEIIDKNPCELVTKAGLRQSSPKRTTIISSEDLGKFWTAFTDFDFQKDSQKVARDVIVLQLCTGLRPIEARSLKWETVDFERKKFKVLNTKNGSDHLLPMTQLTYAMFRERQKDKAGSDYVFRIKGGNTKSPHVTDYRKTLNKICELAEIERVRPHDLRRTVATALNDIEVGYADDMHIMNHSSAHITASTYIQQNLEKIRKILQRLVDYYDLKIPVIEDERYSPYTTGTIRNKVYNIGELSADLLRPEESRVLSSMVESEYWEG
ncbi:MAG: hypothetical protein CMH28_07810 [Micavibrio sp.]|nr:hypothetical protein [Micavibrio sp.]